MPYSDNGIDVLVDNIFGSFIGYACDVGANNGLFLSNSLMFEEKGWIVLCVEPNPLLAVECKANRKLHREVAAASEDSDHRRLNICGAPPYASFTALLDDGILSQGKASDQIFPVVARRLDRILEEAGFPGLDYLTVDAEGSERDIMAGFTVERWKPRVIVLEEWTAEPIIIPGYTITGKHAYDNLYVRDTPCQ